MVIQKDFEIVIKLEYMGMNFGTIWKTTIIMGRNKIVFVGATKVEEYAKSNYGILHQLKEVDDRLLVWMGLFRYLVLSSSFLVSSSI